MGFKQVYVCDVCGKEQAAGNGGYYGRVPKPANWYSVTFRSSVEKIVCSIGCLRNFPAPRAKTAADEELKPVRVFTKRKRQPARSR